MFGCENSHKVQARFESALKTELTKQWFDLSRLVGLDDLFSIFGSFIIVGVAYEGAKDCH